MVRQRSSGSTGFGRKSLRPAARTRSREYSRPYAAVRSRGHDGHGACGFIGEATDLALSLVVGLGGAHPSRLGLLAPPPARDLRHVVAVLGNVLLVLYELVAHRLLGVGGAGAELGHPV